jgi:transcriptional regulator with XRE-family HTH domain
LTSPKLPHASEYKALGRALRELRLTARLTQVQAADAIGIRSKFVSEVERGNRGLRWHTLRSFLRAYQAGLRELADAIERAEAEP